MEGMARYPDKYFDLAIVDPPYGNIDAIGLMDNKKQNKQALKIIKTSILENLEHTKTNPLTFEKKSQTKTSEHFLYLVIE